MANRSMAAKVERARRQGIAASIAEYSKPLWSRHETIAAANTKRQEINALVSKFTGAMTVGKACPIRPEPIGKTRRQYQKATYGNGRRLIGRSADYYELWNTSDALIRNGEVVA